MGNIVKLNAPQSYEQRDVARVKRVIRDMDCDNIMVVGYDSKNQLIKIRSSSGLTLERSVWMLEFAKKEQLKR